MSRLEEFQVLKVLSFRLDRIYSKQEEFSPIAKLLLELSLSKRKDQENLVLEDLFNATDDVLHYKLVVDEPISLLEPFVWEAHWVNLPGETVEPYQCVAEDTA